MSRPLSPSQLQLIQRKRAEAAMRLSQHQKNPGSRQPMEATPHADAHGRGGSAAGDWKSIWDEDFDHSGNDPPETTLPPKHVIDHNCRATGVASIMSRAGPDARGRLAGRSDGSGALGRWRDDLQCTTGRRNSHRRLCHPRPDLLPRVELFGPIKKPLRHLGCAG